MPNYTTNLNLIQPVGDEQFTVNHVNDNADKIDVAVGVLQNIPVITKDPTGFTNNSDIVISYNSTTRKVTLTGTFEAYYRGNKIPSLVSGWESPAHADVQTSYYLYYDGSNIVFNTTPWDFDMLMIAYVQYNSHKIGIREVHGFMPSSVHQVIHNTIGSFKCSGGDFSSFTLNSTVATNRRPQISTTYVCDEDLNSVVAALTTNSYTQRWLTSTGIRNLLPAQTEIIANNGSLPYWNQFTGGNWVQTLFSNNQYGAIFVVAIPVTSDTESQKYRYMFSQPQLVSTSLSNIQSLTPSDLSHGETSSLLSEFVFIGKIIIKASSTSWSLISVEKLEGTKISQTAISGSYLSSVITDATLTGNGTAASPLTVENDGHTHDERYYTETELNAGQLDTRYYTETEVDTIVGELATYTVYTATIPSASWTGASAPYSKAVTVTGMLATDKPIIDLVLTGTYATDVTMRTNWAQVYRVVTSANTITCYADTVPTADISIQLVVVR